GWTSHRPLMAGPRAGGAVWADRGPEPGRLTRTSISFRPNLVARSAAVSAARWAANGVLLRLPLKPTVPAEAKQSVSPLVSVMVTIVLLNVALMWATPRLTFRRALRFLVFATDATLLPSPRVATRRLLNYPRISLTPFLPATVFRGPLRVRALVRVRCPRTGRPRRCRSPRYEPMSFKRAMFCCTWRRSGPSTVYSLSRMFANRAISSSDSSFARRC